MSQRPNILWIVVDDLRADRCGCYGYERPTTPHMDTLAEQGMRVETAIAQGGYSLVSYATMLTGLYPTEHGLFGHPDRLAADIPLIPELLQNEGYRTASIGGNPFLADFFGLTRGFDVAKSWDRINITAPRGRGGLAELELRDLMGLALSCGLSALGVRDKGGSQINAQVVDFIDTGDAAPWFCFIHYMEVHSPYWPPLRYRLPFHTRWTDGGISPFFARHMFDDGLAFEAGETARRLRNDQYDGEVAYTDHLIGALLEALRQREELRNTIVILCSDHGEYLGENGLYRHAAGFGEILVRVPLIVWYPNLINGGSIPSGVVELRDIPHTLCELLECSPLTHTSRPPINLFNSDDMDENRPGFAEWRESSGGHSSRSPRYEELLERADRTARLLRHREWEYIEYEDGERELYNIPQDPVEEVNLAAQKPELLEHFAEKMTKLSEEMVPFSDDTVDEEMPAELEGRLRDLGYL